MTKGAADLYRLELAGGVSRRVLIKRGGMLAEAEAATDKGDENSRPQDDSEVYYAISDYTAVEETQV